MGIGFDRVTNQAGNVRQRSAQAFIIAQNRALAVNVRGSAKALGKRGHGQIVAEEFALAVVKESWVDNDILSRWILNRRAIAHLAGICALSIIEIDPGPYPYP